MSEQFTVAGQSIPTITTAYGGFLILWGVVISQISDSNSITFISITVDSTLDFGRDVNKDSREEEVMDAHCSNIWFALCLGELDFSW